MYLSYISTKYEEHRTLLIFRPTPTRELGLRPRFPKGYHWTPGGTLWLLSRLKCWLQPPPHQNSKKIKKKKSSFFNFSQKKASQLVVKKNELLDPKIEKLHTYCDFENFEPHPQLDMFLV